MSSSPWRALARQVEAGGGDETGRTPNHEPSTYRGLLRPPPLPTLASTCRPLPVRHLPTTHWPPTSNHHLPTKPPSPTTHGPPSRPLTAHHLPTTIDHPPTIRLPYGFPVHTLPARHPPARHPPTIRPPSAHHLSTRSLVTKRRPPVFVNRRRGVVGYHIRLTRAIALLNARGLQFDPGRRHFRLPTI